MISRETFVKTIKDLEDLNKRMSEVDDAMRKLSPDFCGLYIPDVSTIVVDLLQSAINDEADWLGYFIWEKDWLKDFKLGDVEENGEPVKIYDWGDVYDFITRSDKDG